LIFLLEYKVLFVEIRLVDLERFRKERYRDAFKITARLREGSPRVSRRSISDVLRLAEMGRRIVKMYFEVAVWGEERDLKLK